MGKAEESWEIDELYQTAQEKKFRNITNINEEKAY